MSAANTKSPGYAPATRLSPELSQTVVAQGAMKLENPSAQIAYYGYDSDQVNAAGEPLMVPLPSAPTVEAHKTEPDKNTYLVFKKGLQRRGPELRLRHALPVPGPRERYAGLRHPDQPRRGRRPPGDAAGDRPHR